MSVYTVDITEPATNGHRVLMELAQKFNGNVYHRVPGHGSFMVSETPEITREKQLADIRNHLAQAGHQVEEKVSSSGHVHMNITVAPQIF